jgi:hypothetical protein
MGFRFSFSALVLFYFTVEAFFLAPLQLLSVLAQLLCSLQMAPSRTLCFPTVSSLCNPFCSLDGPSHVIDPFSTILYHFLVAPSLDRLHAFVGAADLSCVPLMLYFPIFLLPIFIRKKKKNPPPMLQMTGPNCGLHHLWYEGFQGQVDKQNLKVKL